MPSGRRTPIVKKTLVDAYGYPCGETTFDPLVWPYCTDYKFRDEAHAERHQECVGLAMDRDFWAEVQENEHQLDNAPALVVMVYEVFTSLAVDPSMSKARQRFAAYMTRLMEFSVNTYTWDEWTRLTGGFSTGTKMYSILRVEDPRWSRLKVSLFDLVEEGYQFEAEQMLREAVHWGYMPSIHYPMWTVEHRRATYAQEFIGMTGRIPLDEWGRPAWETDDDDDEEM